jgi:hypothetical protein
MVEEEREEEDVYEKDEEAKSKKQWARTGI